MIFVTRVYSIKCTVVSQKSTYVWSTLHHHRRAGMGPLSCVYAFICSGVCTFFHALTCPPSHTHPHTHTPFTYPHRWQQQLAATVGWWLPCQRGACYFCSPKKASASVIWRNADVEVQLYMYLTWWCHHDVTRDGDMLVLCPDPTHRMTQVSFLGLVPDLRVSESR